MLQRNVRSAADALSYLMDCNLATVEGLALKKSKSKQDYERHISIAQLSFDWCLAFGISVEGTRGEDLDKTVPPMSVEDWAKEIEKKA
jgi:hypothetical protein